MLRECASYMKEAAGEGQLARMLNKGASRDAAVGYLAAFNGLKELLKVRNELFDHTRPKMNCFQAHNNECGLIMNPSDGFGQLMKPFEVRVTASMTFPRGPLCATLTPIIDQAQKGKSKDGITTDPPPMPNINTAWLKVRW